MFSNVAFNPTCEKPEVRRFCWLQWGIKSFKQGDVTYRTQRLPDGVVVAGVEGVEVVANGGGPEDRVLRDDGQTAAQFFQRNPGKSENILMSLHEL